MGLQRWAGVQQGVVGGPCQKSQQGGWVQPRKYHFWSSKTLDLESFEAHGWFVFKSSPYDLFPPHPLVMVGWSDSIRIEATSPNLHGWLWFWDMLVMVVWGVCVCKGLGFGTLGVGV
jgi:hypothetical protein